MIGKFRGSVEIFRVWDRDFGWIYRTASLLALVFALLITPFLLLSKRSQQARQFARAHDSSRDTAETDSSDSGESARSTLRAASSAVDSATLYPFSIIPGGAHNRDELQRAIANDFVVRKHYADFDVSRTRVTRLEHRELMYVSYRIGSEVFWTTEPLALPAGETLLTDGKNTARARCGNRLSATPAGPTSPKEPPSAAMDAAPDSRIYAVNKPSDFPLLSPRLVVPSEAPPALPTLTPPPVGRSGVLPAPLPIPYFPIVGSGDPGGPGTPSGPIVSTPEPGAATLLSAAVALLAFALWRKRQLAYQKGSSATGSR